MELPPSERPPVTRLVLALPANLVLSAAAAGCAAAIAPPAGATLQESGPPQATGGRADGFTFRPAAEYDAGVPTPESLLGYGIGARFTEHRDLARVVRAIDEASPRVAAFEYGRSPEGRPLLLAFVGSARNLDRREEIARELLELADPRVTGDDEAARRIGSAVPIAWLSYNVHGNEPSSSETALAVLYHLAAAGDEATRRLLDELLVVIDPCLNPDGRDRYVHWYHSVAGPTPDPEPAAREHDEPPPGGRVNHYHFDLNRDWAFATQDETRARLQWLARFPPQVHVDFHEMGADSTYFFFPADLPRNLNLPRSTLQWGERFGRGNAEAFDRHGWLYYTGEFFDLLYPGYGDSFPSLRGAIGMTYEQAGHSAAGLAFARDDGELLTLEDRAAHHFAASLATLETARAGRTELLGHWRGFHVDALREGRAGPMREVALLPVPDRTQRRRLVELLLLHGIEVEAADAAFVARGVHGYDGRADDERVLPEGTVLVPMAQPQKRLAKALLEPRAGVERTTFYDISAWSLPYAFGVEACWLEQPAEVARTRVAELTLAAGGGVPSLGRATEGGAEGARLGFILPWDDAAAAPALLELLADDPDARMLPRPFATADRVFSAGSTFLRRRRGEEDPSERWLGIARSHAVDLVPVESGFTARGIDLGSERAIELAPPRVLLLASDGGGFGELRFLLERELRVPFTTVEPDALAGVRLHEWNVMLVPEDAEGLEGAADPIGAFVRGGGSVLAFGRAARFFTQEESGITSITAAPDEDEKSAAEERAEAEKKSWRKSAELEREATLQAMPGALFEVELDPGHPLAFGLPERIPMLATGDSGFRIHGGGTKIGRFAEGGRLSGFAGERPQEELLGRFWLVEEEIGEGRVILFSESPTFRLGFRGPIRVLMNALAYGSR